MSAEDLTREAVVAAHRERGVRGEIHAHGAWFDLDDAARAEVFEATRTQRLLEAALDPEGLSTTAKEALRRIRRG